MIPPPYPRIPHLFPQPGVDADDKILPPRRASLLLCSPLIVEEKLDGFNVAIARDGAGWPTPYSRSGKCTGDRGGQLGRIRAFLGTTSAAFDPVLASWPVLYAEWLMRQHSVAYDALPSWLIVLDLWSPTAGFAGADERDRVCAEAGLFTPARLYAGVVGEVARLASLTERSRFGSLPAEGVILRDMLQPTKSPVAKWLAPGFRRRSDSELARAGHNQLRTDGRQGVA